MLEDVVADSGFPRGRANPKGGGGGCCASLLFGQIFLENEENWAEREGLTSEICLCGSATEIDYQVMVKLADD